MDTDTSSIANLNRTDKKNDLGKLNPAEAYASPGFNASKGGS